MCLELSDWTSPIAAAKLEREAKDCWGNIQNMQISQIAKQVCVVVFVSDWAKISQRVSPGST